MPKTKLEILNDCRRKNYDQVCVTLPKGQRDILKQKAQQENISLNQWIQKAIEYYIQKSD